MYKYKYKKAAISALCDVTEGMTLHPGGSQQPSIRFSGKTSHRVLHKTVKFNTLLTGNQRCEGAPLDSGMGNKDLVKCIFGTKSPQVYFFAQSTLLSNTLSENEVAALSTPPSHRSDRALDTRELLKRVKCGSGTNRKSILSSSRHV